MAWVCDSDSIREAVGSAAGTVDRSGSPSCPDQLTYFAGSRADSAANQAWRLQVCASYDEQPSLGQPSHACPLASHSQQTTYAALAPQVACPPWNTHLLLPESMASAVVQHQPAAGVTVPGPAVHQGRAAQQVAGQLSGKASLPFQSSQSFCHSSPVHRPAAVSWMGQPEPGAQTTAPKEDNHIDWQLEMRDGGQPRRLHHSGHQQVLRSRVACQPDRCDGEQRPQALDYTQAAERCRPLPNTVDCAVQPGLVSQDGQCDGDSFASCYFSGSLAFGSNVDPFDLSDSPASDAGSICNSQASQYGRGRDAGASQLLDSMLESCNPWPGIPVGDAQQDAADPAVWPASAQPAEPASLSLHQQPGLDIVQLDSSSAACFLPLQQQPLPPTPENDSWPIDRRHVAAPQRGIQMFAWPASPCSLFIPNGVAAGATARLCSSAGSLIGERLKPACHVQHATAKLLGRGKRSEAHQTPLDQPMLDPEDHPATTVCWESCAAGDQPGVPEPNLDSLPYVASCQPQAASTLDKCNPPCTRTGTRSQLLHTLARPVGLAGALPVGASASVARRGSSRGIQASAHANRSATPVSSTTLPGNGHVGSPKRSRKAAGTLGTQGSPMALAASQPVRHPHQLRSTSTRLLAASCADEHTSALSAKEVGRYLPVGSADPSGVAPDGMQPGGAPEHAAEAQAVLDTPGQASSGPRKRGRPALCAQGPEGPIEHVDLAMLQAGGYLDMPIAQAARTLGMSLTSMKVTASEQGIQRWPFRSRQSLRHIIENTKQLVVDKVLSIQDGLQMEQLLDALGEELQDVGMSPTPCISATIRRYRQSIFKITHKLKTTPGLHATVPIAVRTALAARKPPHAMVHN